MFPGYARTDASGNYMIGHIPIGDGTCRALLSRSGTSAEEWFNDKSSFGVSDPVPLEPRKTTTGISAQLALQGMVSGRVTDGAGGGLNGVRVYAYDTIQDIVPYSAVAFTSGDGNYSLGLPTATVRIFFDPGFASLYRPEFYNDKFTFASADGVSVTSGGTTPNINAQLGLKPLFVTSPNGGERWTAGSLHNITWTQTGLTGPVTIDLYKGGIPDRTLGSADVTAGTFSWVIGAGQAAGTDYKIRIQQGTISDESDGYSSIIRAVKWVDFNKDGREDILWRYHGEGGYNRAWFLGNSEPVGLQAETSDVLMRSGRISSGTIGNSASRRPIRPLQGMGIVPDKRARPAFRTSRDLMGGAKKSTVQDKVADPRSAGGRNFRPFPGSILDPRQVRSGIAVAAPRETLAEPASAPALLGGGDIMPVGDLNWRIVGTGHFNGDADVDILWRNISTGSNVVWFMNGTDWAGSAELLPVADLSWQIVGTGDFNNDTHVDILWRNVISGENVVWYMNGTTWIGSVALLGVSDPNWQIVGTGDFNNDTHVDILWRYNGAGGYNVVWYMNNASWTGSAELIPVGDATWQIAGTGDYNNDGNIDILWRYNGPGGYNYIWYLNGVTWIGGGDLLPVGDQTWRVVSR
jgi:hypothetical protein